MTGTALIGCARHGNGNLVSRRFESGKAYTSSDGTVKAVVGDVRRGKYSSRVCAQIDDKWHWCEIGRTGGVEVFTIETRRGVYVIMAGGESRVAWDGR